VDDKVCLKVDPVVAAFNTYNLDWVEAAHLDELVEACEGGLHLDGQLGVVHRDGGDKRRTDADSDRLLTHKGQRVEDDDRLKVAAVLRLHDRALFGCLRHSDGRLLREGDRREGYRI